METWRDIKGYEGFYQVSNEGRVRSLDRTIYCKNGKTKTLKSKLKKTVTHSTGYLYVGLCRDCGLQKIYVHDLVALGFPEICGEWFEGAQVNHKNENKTDNRAINLEVCTAKYNSNYGTSRERCAEKLINRKDTSKAINQFTKEGVLVKEWLSLGEIERAGFNRSTIRNVLCKIKSSKTAYGYKWEYAKQ